MPVNEQFKYVYLPAWRAMAHCFVGDGEYESVCRSNTIASNYYLFAIVNSTGSAWPCARIYHQHPHPHQLSNIVDRIGAMHSNRLFIFFSVRMALADAHDAFHHFSKSTISDLLHIELNCQ